MKTCVKCGAQYEGAELFCPVDGARLAATQELAALAELGEPPDSLVGRVIQNRYKVLKRIGEGGMGVVYVAEHVEIEKKVALKVLRDDFSKRPDVVARFRQEARSASRIGHPNICDVNDFGQLEDGGVYFVMEYLKGQPLADLVRTTILPLARAVPIVAQICRGLHAAHAMGIVHRDLKPENVFLIERDGNPDFVKILDFGIAKISDRDAEGQRLTKTGMIFGTPEYMSPEQAAGRSLDHRVDVYALGCMMFEMFTGRVPFSGDTFMAVLTQHMFEPVPTIAEVRPETDVPPAVELVVQKAMAKDANERYPDMNALEADLERALTESGLAFALPRGESTGRVVLPTPLTLTATRPGRKTGTGSGGSTKLDWNANSGQFASRKRRLGMWLGLGAAVIVAGLGAAGYLLLGRGGALVATVPVTVPAAEEPPVAIPAPVVAPTPTPAPVPVPALPVAVPGVEVTISAEPVANLIEVEGLGQVCARTPCTVTLPAGRPAIIRGSDDAGARAELTFTPSAENRAAKLELKAPPPRRERGERPPRGERDPVAADKPADKPQPKPDDGGGLKIPDIFKQN